MSVYIGVGYAVKWQILRGLLT